MKILVTGSSGYLGSNFIEHFQGEHSFLKFSLLKNPINTINFDNIDIVLHCAALVHQKKEHDYEKYYDANTKYPIALAKKAKESGVKQFVFISTIAVYGEEEEIIDENTVCNPVSSYGKSKLEAERQLEELNDQSFTVSIIRPPMVYGKDAPGNIASLINLVKRISILPFGKIENKRSFVYIGNLIYTINQVIEQKQSGIFLACDDEPLSTTKLIELIAKYMHKKVWLLKIPFFDSLLKSLKPSLYKRLYDNLEVNNSHTKKVLDLNNPYIVEEGIKLMLKDAPIGISVGQF